MIDHKKIADRVLALAKGAGATVAFSETRTGATRFAVNQITSSSDVTRTDLTVTVQYGQRAATAVTNQLDDRALLDVVARAQRMARLAPENPEMMLPLTAQHYLPVPGAEDAATVALGPAVRAKAAATAIAGGGGNGVTIAGFYQHVAVATTLATSGGLYAQHRYTECNLACTARTADATGSGWAGTSSNRAADLDAGALAKVAVEKATRSAKPRHLDAGRYTVILEPAAAGELLTYLTGSLDARPADEGRSFFAKKTLGDTLFPPTISVRALPQDPRLAVVPFDEEGLPRAPLTWIDKGVVTHLRHDRFWGKKQGKPPIATPGGWQLDGGAESRESLIKGVKRGVLVTRFWYVNLVDPMTLLATGLTRDGTFLIENGEIAHPVNNFRFNESPVQMLARCDGLTSGVLTADGARIPTLRTHEFNLASVSEAV